MNDLLQCLQVESVELIAKGIAPVLVQPTEGATYDPALNKKELQQVCTNFKSLNSLCLFNS